MERYRRILPSAIFTGLLMVLAPLAEAQSTPRPLLFDVLTTERISHEESDRILQGRIQRIATEMRRRPQAKTVLIHYRARVRESRYNPSAYGNARTAESQLSNRNGRYVDDGKVVLLDGGVRETETLEFWLVPKGAGMPIATPEFSRDEVIDCPQISAYQVGHNFDKAHRVELMARLYPESDTRFDWSVTRGEIVDSDHFAKATLDVSNIKENQLIATVRASGLPPLCSDSASVVVSIGHTPKLADRFGRLPNGDIKARLDAFATDLSNHADKHGYIYVYGSRDERGRDTAGRIRLIENQLFLFRKFDRTRVTIRNAGYRNDLSTDFWIVPSGQEAPKPTPTTEREFVERAARSSRPAR